MKVTDQRAFELLFENGRKAYEYFGVHHEEKRFVFRAWFPNASQVHLVGDFNDWQEGLPLKQVTSDGVWEVKASDANISLWNRYKYRITDSNGTYDKGDPYAFAIEDAPQKASIVTDLASYNWRDAGWMAFRKKHAEHFYRQPMNLYEVHLGSWRRHEDGSAYTYTKLASKLAPYIKQMGYTHVALLLITDAFAPCAEFGTPLEFMSFVDSMHEAGIGVIMDWCPGEMSMEHGMVEGDGTCFLASNAFFWIEAYHIDGLRVTGDFPLLNNEGNNHQWQDFFRRLNRSLKQTFPDVLLITESRMAAESITSFENQGLGFDLVWNQSWSSDLFSYAELDPLWRKYHHEKVTFSLTGAFEECYILPIAHSEVINGKKSFLDKMSGDYWKKFASVRAFLGYMMTHPGKKMLFMGTEIGQFQEWNSKSEIEWFLLEYESHAKLQRYVSDLNHFYLSQTPLWQRDDSWEGFCWLDADNRNQSILTFRRRGEGGTELIVLLNFTPVVYEDFRVGVPAFGIYEELFNSDSEEYGGSGVMNVGPLKCETIAWNFLPQSIRLRIPPLGMTVLHCKKKTAKTTKSK